MLAPRLSLRIALFVILQTFCAVLVAGPNKWSNSGPFGGSPGSFLILPQNPKIVFASGDALFRSTNGGVTWISTELPGGIVRAHPRTGEIFAFGFAVFRSTNQGANWQLVGNNSFQGVYASDAELDPSNPQILYASTNEKGVFKSLNGGKTWQPTNAGLDFKQHGECYGEAYLEIDPRNPNNLYTLLPSCQAFKSTNGASSWQAINNGLSFNVYAAGLAIDPINPQVLYLGGGGGIFKTTNSGGNWTNTSCDCGVEDLAVDPKNSQIVYGAAQGVVKSVDGGKTWRHVLFPAGQYLATVAALGNTVFAGVYGLAGVYRSNNGGTSFRESNRGFTNQTINFLAVHPSRPRTLFGSDGGTLFKSANGGTSWIRVKSAESLNAGDITIHPLNASLIVMADSVAIADISTNGGATWVQRKGLNDFDSAVIGLDPMNQNNMFAGSYQNQGVARSTDRGTTWSLANSGLGDLSISAIAVRDGQNLLVGTAGGKVFRTSNGGGSWANSSAGLGVGEIVHIVMDRTDANVVYLVTNYRGKGIYKSTDGGISWKLKNKGVPVGTGLSLHPTKSNVLYAPGYGGVYTSRDGGEKWSLLPSNGLGVLQVYLFQVNPGLPDIFYAGTNRGVYTYARTVVPGGPVIDQTNPPAARAGSPVTIYGANFGTSQGSSKVVFGTSNAGTAQSWSDTQVTVKIPSSILTGPLLIEAGKQSNTVDFVVPSSSGRLNPAQGSPGTRVTLTLPFRLSSGTVLVQFGTSLATDITLTPPNLVTCIAPPGSGVVPVTVYSGYAHSALGAFTYR